MVAGLLGYWVAGSRPPRNQATQQLSNQKTRASAPRRSPFFPKPFMARREYASIGQSDDQDQGGERADSDPDPFLTGQTGRLELLEVLGQLMQILRRHFREPLLDLLLREAVRGEHGRDLLVGRNCADDGQVGITGVDALIRRCLRGNRTGERGNGREGQEKNNYEEDVFSGHEQPP